MPVMYSVAEAVSRGNTPAKFVGMDNAARGTLAGFILRQRERLGMSQTELATALGLTRSHLSQIEKGKIALPNADIRRRLALALGVSHQAILVAAGELSEEEAGAALAYRPPFAEGDIRRRIVARLPDLRDDDAEAVLIITNGLADRRRTISAQHGLSGPGEPGEKPPVGVGQPDDEGAAVESGDDKGTPVPL
jgi:transcriptional regulator with XRE-family HTH domain